MGNKHTRINCRKWKHRHTGSKKQAKYGMELEIGRISVTRPRFGRIDIYIKADNNRGAAVVCEKDGLRCGVTAGVLKRFPEPGSHKGWAYVNRGASRVFKFVAGDASKVPPGLFSIETIDGPVDFPGIHHGFASYPDGALVAFYARLVRPTGNQQFRRRATDVFLLDSGHLPLVVRLISAGRLDFPEHNELCELFLDALPDQQGQDMQCKHLYASALSHLASSSDVPSRFQSFARVEQTKLSLMENPPAAIPRQRPQAPEQVEARDTKKKEKLECTGQADFVADVVPVHLQIEKE